MQNNDSNFTAPVPDWSDTPLAVFLNFLEILLYIAAIITCIRFIRLIRKTRVFHVNLGLLLGHLGIACITLGFTRIFAIVQIIILYFSGNCAKIEAHGLCWFINTVFYCCLYIIALTPITLVVERSIATVRVKKYEKEDSVFIGVLLIVAQWLFCLMAIFLSEIEKYFVDDNSDDFRTCPDQGQIFFTILMLSFCVLVAMDVFAMVAFIMLLTVNKGRYSKTFLEVQTHSLSERYQLSENIKTTRFICPVVAVNFFIVICCIALEAFVQLILNEKASYNIIIAAQISDHTFYMLVAGYAAAFPWISVYGHPELRRQARNFFGHHGARVAPYEPRNANGAMLILGQSEERDMHFAALQSMWN